MKAYKLEVTAVAKQNYSDIALNIYEQSKSVDVAVKFVRRLQSDIERLRDFPEIGAFPKDRILLAAGYRYLVCGEYLTFYTIDETAKKVYILAIFNAKEDYTRVLSMEAYENLQFESEVYFKLLEAEQEEKNGGKRYSLKEARKRSREAVHGNV